MTDHVFSFSVPGMHCGSCVGRVEKALSGVSDVQDATANLATRQVKVVSNAGDVQQITNALDAAGFPAEQSILRLGIDGMTCASCVGRVEQALRAVPGVLTAEVNLATREARVTTPTGIASHDAVLQALQKAGYPGQPLDDGQTPKNALADEIASLRRAALVAALLTLPVFVLEMGSHLFPPFHHWIAGNIGLQTSRILQFVLTTAVLAGPGRMFLARGIPALVRAAPDMNSLVAIGTSAAWGFSVLATFAPSLLPEGRAAVYFEAAAVIVTLILLGRYLEARAKGKTGAAIQRLMALTPDTAEIEQDGTTRAVPVSQIAVGDIVLLRPGGRVAVDGVVSDGQSYVDESMISGEPVPVRKTTGDPVVAGTLNGTGAIRYVAQKVGQDTVLAEIIRMVDAAQSVRLPIQDLVNRVTGWFVPAVLAIALITALVWSVSGAGLGPALVAAVAVLIIACPCAMGLATPTSIMVGTERAAEMGVLFRKGDALQALSTVSVVAFDKTGTLTQGRPELVTFEVEPGWDPDAVLTLVASAEAQSEHPVATAITRAVEARGLTLRTVRGFSAFSGLGLQATVDDTEVLIGSDRLMQQEGLLSTEMSQRAIDIANAAQTPLFAALGRQVVAVMGVADPIKPGAAQAIAALHAQGRQTAMITGDHRGTAQAIARQLGIDEVVAGVLPGGKVEAISRLGQNGPLAFVGDGINDAPALAHADVGIALGTGTDVAIEAADVVLASGDLNAVTRAFAISRATMRNIRQNLGWAFGYNVLLIPVAAGVLYPLWGVLLSPALAAGAMALSSVAVVTNALRLKHVEQEPETSTQNLGATGLQSAE